MTLYDLMLTPVMNPIWPDVDPCNEPLYDLMLTPIMYQDPYLEFLGTSLLGGLDDGLELFDSEGEVGDPLDHSNTLGYCVSSPRLRDNTYNPTIHWHHFNTLVLSITSNKRARPPILYSTLDFESCINSERNTL